MNDIRERVALLEHKTGAVMVSSTSGAWGILI